MNKNMARLLERLETTKVPTVTGTLRAEAYESHNGQVCMCPLGHLVDLYIEDTPDAKWAGGGRFFEPGSGGPEGYPGQLVLALFGLTENDAEKIYRQNDRHGKTPAQVAQFIREEII